MSSIADLDQSWGKSKGRTHPIPGDSLRTAFCGATERAQNSLRDKTSSDLMTEHSTLSPVPDAFHHRYTARFRSQTFES